MPEMPASDIQSINPLEQPSLWEENVWEDMEKGLLEMAGTDEATPPPLNPAAELLEPQNKMLSAQWAQSYQNPGDQSHYEDAGNFGTYHEQYIQTRSPPLASTTGYSILNTQVDTNNVLVFYFWIGGPIDLQSFPGSSEYIIVAAFNDTYLTDLFDSYFSQLDARLGYVQPRDLRTYNFLQAMVFKGELPYPMSYNYYGGAKSARLMISDKSWDTRQNLWLVGSERQQAFLGACGYVSMD